MHSIRITILSAFLLAPFGLPAGETATNAGVWTPVFDMPEGAVSGREFCKPVLMGGRLLIWGPPGDNPATDWCAGALELSGLQWKPLVPAGKESWLKERPKMRYWTRWGEECLLDSADGLLQPVPMAYFNQAVYIPTLKEAIYFLGGRTLTFDPETALWQELQTAVHPPLTIWGALEYDAVNDEVVLFGGGAQCPENSPGTWLFSVKNLSWRRLDQPPAEQPPPRCNAPLVYDIKNKGIVVFGGDAQDHCLSDTWIYDCATRRWKEIKTNVQPYPRLAPALCALGDGRVMMGGAVPPMIAGPDSFRASPGPFGSETWVLDVAAATWTRVPGEFPAGPWTSAVYDADKGRVLLCREEKQRLEVYSWRPTFTTAKPGMTAPAKPVYRYLPPEWYSDGLPPPDENAGAALIKSLPANRWTRYEPPRSGMMRTWGTAILDPATHEILYWGGGHCGYCGTDVSHFSLKTLRWSTGFTPELPPLPFDAFYGEQSSFVLPCRSFHGRPWTQHGRISYEYDPLTKKVAFTQSISSMPSRKWTYIYDPIKRDFVDTFAQPFIGAYTVSGLCVSSPYGVFDYFSLGDSHCKGVGLFQLDIAARCWTNVSGGKASAPSHEQDRVLYDSRRDRLLLLSRDSRPRVKTPAIYACDLKPLASDWSSLELSGELPARFGRESVYIRKCDRIVSLNEGGLFSCDLSNSNRCAHTAIGLPPGLSYSANTALLYDPELDALVAFSGNNTGPVGIWFLRYEPEK